MKLPPLFGFFFGLGGWGGRGTSHTHLEIVEGGGPLINVFLRAYFDVFRQLRFVIFAHQNTVRSMFMEFL